MIIVKNNSGSYTISELVLDYTGREYYIDRTFLFYTKREALRLFKAHLKENNLTIS